MADYVHLDRGARQALSELGEEIFPWVDRREGGRRFDRLVVLTEVACIHCLATLIKISASNHRASSYVSAMVKGDRGVGAQLLPHFLSSKACPRQVRFDAYRGTACTWSWRGQAFEDRKWGNNWAP